jgi:hypothetical protein
MDDEDDDEDEEDGWDPENTHIILDEYNLISDEIRFGDWPQVSPSNSIASVHSNSVFTFGRGPTQSLQQQQMLNNHSNNGQVLPMQVPVYDRLANPSYYTGHMRNVFDGKNIEQKRKKVQKIKERKVPSTPAPGGPSSEWKKPSLGDERGVMGGENCSANTMNNSSKTPSAKGESSKSALRVAAAGLSAQRPQRQLNRANSVDWAIIADATQQSSINSSHSSSSRATPKRPDRRSSVGSIITATTSLTSLSNKSRNSIQLEEDDSLMDGTMI